MKLRFIMLLLLAGVLWSSAEAAEKPLTLNVWPDKAPGEQGDIGEEKVLPQRKGARTVERLTNVSRPTITVFRPAKEKNTGAAVLICPGGGYQILAWDLEGTEVAQWLNTIGVTAVVLKYRVPRRANLEKHAAPLQDAQRAMRLLRQHAQEWEVDPARIGILGFSAGGHLSATMATNFDQRRYDRLDAIDDLDCRPDFAVLIYPAYLVAGDHLAAEIRVGPKTPPAFLVHADNDPLGSESSVAMYSALKKAGVSAELHIYASGGHGFGLRPSEHPASTWPRRCEQWLNSQGLLNKP